MHSVFVAGSRALSKLTAQVKERLDNILRKEFTEHSIGSACPAGTAQLEGHSLFCVREIVVSAGQIGPYPKQTRRLSRSERYQGIIGIQSQENWSIRRQLDV